MPNKKPTPNLLIFVPSLADVLNLQNHKEFTTTRNFWIKGFNYKILMLFLKQVSTIFEIIVYKIINMHAAVIQKFNLQNFLAIQ